MKLTAILVLLSLFVHGQQSPPERKKWKIDKNKIITGSLFLLSGSAKGFNETLQFNYGVFEDKFPGADDQWFDPKISWRNKYRNGHPDNGPRFFLSTSLLVMFTDQYHLNNFVHRVGIVSALVVKIGEGKKPFKYYLFDALYYAACYQAGFSVMYYPFVARGNK